MRAFAPQVISHVTPAASHSSGQRNGAIRIASVPVPVNGNSLLQCKSACACGGGCPRCEQERKPPLQTKLNISTPGDHYEQEADRIAEQVMRMPEPQSEATLIASASNPASLLRRKCAACDEEQKVALPDEEKAVQRQEFAEDAPRLTPEIDAHINSLRGKGEPLPESMRAFFEPRFGQDFSQVRVHTDAKAAESARALKARAYTLGRDIVFGEAQYAPGTSAGQTLLAHELTHVMQQTGGDNSELKVQRASDSGQTDSTPEKKPGLHLDTGFYLPVIPDDPVGAFITCQTILTVTGLAGVRARCGANFTGLPCPPPFCTPFPTVSLAQECRDKNLMTFITAFSALVGDTKVAPLWMLYLKGGTSIQLDLSAAFGTDFADVPASQRAGNFLRDSLQTYLQTAAPTLFVGAGPWTMDFSRALAPQIAELEPSENSAGSQTARNPHELFFEPPSTIPGLLAGGTGLNQASCSAGNIPSAFADRRLAKVSATVYKSQTLPGRFVVTPQINLRVEDTIDFCPGNCGTGMATLAATVLLSALEASGVSGDVPFLVDYNVPVESFII
jgi:hypothetical protein